MSRTITGIDIFSSCFLQIVILILIHQFKAAIEPQAIQVGKTEAQPTDRIHQEMRSVQSKIAVE